MEAYGCSSVVTVMPWYESKFLAKLNSLFAQSLSFSGVRDRIALMAELESTTIQASGIQPS